VDYDDDKDRPMTEANPFASEPHAPIAATRQLPVLPLHLAGVVLLMSAISLVMSLVSWLMNDVTTDLAFWVRYVLTYWLNHLLMAGLSVYWLANVYMERHCVASYRQPAALLVSYGVIYLALSWALGYASGQLYMWLYEHVDMYGSGRLLMNVGWWFVGLLSFCLEALLPLWLLLQLFRSKAEVGTGDVQVPGATLAWCFALAVLVVYLQLAGLMTQLVSGMLYGYEFEGWEGVVNLIHGALYLLVAFFTARAVLPAHVRGFNGGRLILAVSITLLLWIGSAVLGAIIMLVLLWVGLVTDLVLVVLFGLLQMVLLWPFSRLGLRWGYRAQAAQA
jgi:hypothetical protein